MKNLKNYESFGSKVNESFWTSIFGKPTVDDAAHDSLRGQGFSHRGKDEDNYIMKPLETFTNEALSTVTLTSLINECKARQLKRISEFKSTYKTELNKANKVVNVYQVIDKFSKWLADKTPAMVNDSLANRPGTADKVVTDAYTFIYKEIQNQLKTISLVKKAAIKLIAPSAADFDSQKKDENLEDQIIELADSLFDVGYLIGYHFHSEPIKQDNTMKWSGAFTKSLNSRRSSIYKNIKLLIRKFLYS
jgi:hypothetical protein